MVRLATAKLRIRNRPRSSIGWRARASQSEEEGEAGDAGDQRHPDQRVAPAVGRLLDQGEDRAAEPGGREHDPEPVDAAEGVGVAALLDRVQGERDRDRDQRQVDPEDRPPGERLDQGAAAGRAEHGRDPGPGGPGADRLAALRALEGGGDDRQRARAPAAPRRSPAGRGRRPGTRPRARPRRATEVAPKPTSPATNIRRRPNWSPSEPPTSSSETSVSR